MSPDGPSEPPSAAGLPSPSGPPSPSEPPSAAGPPSPSGPSKAAPKPPLKPPPKAPVKASPKAPQKARPHSKPRTPQHVRTDSGPRVNPNSVSWRVSSPVAGRDAGNAGQVRRAFLALGSNLGDRHQQLVDAVAALPDVVAVSPVYETEPVGGPRGQGAYLNCVVELATARSPHELLAAAQAAETAARRVRLERWGPRTLDVDVLLVGELEIDDDHLTVPHPRMWHRGFVLIPLADLAPELVAGNMSPELARGVHPAGNL